MFPFRAPFRPPFRRRPVRSLAAACLSLLALAAPLGAATGSVGFGDWASMVPDNAWARQQLADLLVKPVAELTPALNRTLSQVLEPRQVRFSVIRSDKTGFVYLVFTNRQGNGFPDEGPGTTVVRRTIKGGGVDQVKVFLSSEPLLYLRAVRDGAGSLVSVFHRDNAQPIVRDLPVPLSIERLALTPTPSLLRMTQPRVGWEHLLVRPPATAFAGVERMTRTIRAALPTLPDADDGAMEADGSFVRIDGSSSGAPGLNCSGFAKWVVDGLFAPLSRSSEGHARYLAVAPLAERLVSARYSIDAEPFEESRDPWFGLDWTRNLARSYESLRTRAALGPEETDVRDIPFLGYVEDRGYPAADLGFALFQAAIRDPDAVYLGAINGWYGDKPKLWQYFHVVVLLPRFDAAGAFRCAVFERNRESSLSELAARYKNGEFVHLVQVRASERFEPPAISW